jgi:diaminohydroxyphosphoribosylaminopyrimidine deaminase/5-amino-6-(5-phosphoribosylamino)uracil reductase
MKARSGPLPVRVVLGGRLRTPVRARVLADGPPTLVFTKRGAPAARARALRAAGAEVIEVAAPAGRVSLPEVLRALAERGLQSVLVEGGAAVNGAFVAAGLVDDVAFFIAPKVFGAGIPVTLPPTSGLPAGLILGPLAVRSVGKDLLLTAPVLGGGA